MDDEAAQDVGRADPRLGDHLKFLTRKAQNAYGKVVDVAAPPVGKLAETVKEQPLASVAVAAVAGAALTKLGRRRRR